MRCRKGEGHGAQLRADEVTPRLIDHLIEFLAVLDNRGRIM
jgi:hypothetical protein